MAGSIGDRLAASAFSHRRSVPAIGFPRRRSTSAIGVREPPSVERLSAGWRAGCHRGRQNGPGRKPFALQPIAESRLAEADSRWPQAESRQPIPNPTPSGCQRNVPILPCRLAKNK